jgi:hypothetical protein
MNPRRTCLLSVLAALALAAPASADSIVYTKGPDIWVAEPDGSGERQVTRDGTSVLPYQSPSQADDGTIVAQRGTRFLRLDRNGAVLATLNSVLTNKPDGISAVGPFDPQVSPDGSKIAYWIGMYSTWFDYGTNINFVRTGPVTIWMDARSGQHLGATHYYEEPSWLADSSRALLFESTNGATAQVMVAGVAEDHNQIRQWFHDLETKPVEQEYWYPIGAGELTRAGNRLAALRGSTFPGNGGEARGPGNTIALYDVSSLESTPTMWPCVLAEAVGGEFGKPTWSPGGDALAGAEGDGIWPAAAGAGCGAMAPHRVIAGGKEPDWGPASPGVGAAPGPSPAGDAAPALHAPKRVRARALRAGLPVHVSCAGACAARLTLHDRGRRLATKALSLTAAGERMVRVRVSARAAARLGRRGHRVLTLRLRAGGHDVVRTIAVRR